MSLVDLNKFIGRFDTLEWRKRDKECEFQIGRDLWHKYAQGYDINEYNRMLIKGKRLGNLNLSFNINPKSPLIIF